MTYWILVPLLALVAILQSTLLPLLPLGGFKLDLALIVVVVWGLLGTPGEAAIWGFIAGIFLDLLSGLPFGSQTFALTVVGLVMGLTQTTIFRSNILLPPSAMILATLLYDILILAILSTLGWPIPWQDYILRVTLPTALLNTLALPVVLIPLQRLHRRLRPQVEW